MGWNKICTSMYYNGFWGKLMHFHLQLLFPEAHETQEARFSGAVVVWHYQWILAAELAYLPAGG